MRAADEARREATAEVRVAGVVLKPSQRDALAEAERLAGGGLEERRKATALVRGVEAELRAARDGVSVQAGVVDTLARAEARGEVFEIEAVEVGDWRKDGHGALVRVKGQPVLDVKTVRRARRVDGLASLHRGGLLTDQQWGVANAYRALCESARPPIGVAAIEPRVGNAWADPEAPMAAAIERGFAGDQLRQVHDAMSPEQAVVLQAVAGRGESVRGLAGGGRRWQANHSLLIEALAIADLTFRAVRNSRLPDRNAKCI